MRLSSHIKRIVIECICLLYALLFVYASVSKIMDFERFRVQLSQSPILSAFAAWISWAVIGIELLIAALILYNKTRTIALFAALSLMSMFTAYIFIILHFSSFVPCSCGGILEKMTWEAHLIFNLFFVLMSIIALGLQNQIYQQGVRKIKMQLYLLLVFFLILISILFMIILYLFSEQIIHHHNPFIRRYPKSAVILQGTIDVKFNSYYFAGNSNRTIYLGNYTDPLHLLSIDETGSKKTLKLHFDHRELSFRSIRILIRDNNIYLLDGTVPCIFRGNLQKREINTELKGMPSFTVAQPMDSATIAFRNNTGKNKTTVLGIFYAGNLPHVRYAPHLLKRQIDGVFDSDGMLIYNEEMKLFVYNYFYRNEFIAADRNGSLKITGHTIDTIRHAKIKVAYLKNNTERQMGAPPLKVNTLTTTKNNLLFVNSKVPGRYDDLKHWSRCTVIDVYNLKKNSYVMSFVIYHNPDLKVQDLFVTDTHFYVIAGGDLMIYDLGDLLRDEMKIALEKMNGA